LEYDCDPLLDEPPRGVKRKGLISRIRRCPIRVVLQPPRLLFLRFGLERGLAFPPAEEAVTPQTPQSVAFWVKTQLKYRIYVGVKAHSLLLVLSQ
jgi:hypothetical protein